MELQLTVNNSLRVLPVVRSFVSDSLSETSLEEELHNRLVELIVQTVEDAICHAYQPNEDGDISIRIKESHGKLELTVRDYGMPQDVLALESQLHQDNGKNTRLFGISCKDIADEVHWTGFGREGKALNICKWLHNTDITESSSEAELSRFSSDIEPAPEQEYTIRRMEEGEGLQVSQLIYKAYGGTYFNADIYYPERIESLNKRGINLSYVALDDHGRVVGHYALERNVEGPVAEGGEAVVDPAHRGRKLLEKMKQIALKEARQMELAGVYADAVTVHPYTQKSNVRFGAKLACANLGIAPCNEHFLGLAEDLPQRVSCLLYYMHLGGIERRKRSYVPGMHRQIVEEIYNNLGFSVEFGNEKQPEGRGECSVTIDACAGKAFIRFSRIGEDTVHTVRHTRRELVEHSHAEVFYADLPLTDPGTPAVVRALDDFGFSIAGIAPHFSDAGDMLRLVYLTEPLKRQHIVTYEDFAGRLVEYVLAEQERVRRKI